MTRATRRRVWIELRTRDRERKLIRKIEQSIEAIKTMTMVSVKPGIEIVYAV